MAFTFWPYNPYTGVFRRLGRFWAKINSWGMSQEWALAGIRDRRILDHSKKESIMAEILLVWR
jgi:hypothetical protein